MEEISVHPSNMQASVSNFYHMPASKTKEKHILIGKHLFRQYTHVMLYIIKHIPQVKI